jgi:hypothetical protein
VTTSSGATFSTRSTASSRIASLSGIMGGPNPESMGGGCQT